MTSLPLDECLCDDACCVCVEMNRCVVLYRTCIKTRTHDRQLLSIVSRCHKRPAKSVSTAGSAISMPALHSVDSLSASSMLHIFTAGSACRSDIAPKREQAESRRVQQQRLASQAARALRTRVRSLSVSRHVPVAHTQTSLLRVQKAQHHRLADRNAQLASVSNSRDVC